MRRLSFATLIFAVGSMSFLGCRQTAGPTAGGSMSSSSMSPAMQSSPSFNPFGGSTRVSPPPPNASVAPNPYIGGPPGQAGVVQGPAGSFVAAAPGVSPTSGQVVGSGIQPAGFVGAGVNPTAQAGFATGTFNSATPNTSVATAAYGTTAPANVNPFRAGGMQVNDLTRAPAPPGYRAPVTAGSPASASYQPPVPSNSVPVMTTSGQFGTPAVQSDFAPMSAPITPANGAAGTGSVPGNLTPIEQMPTHQMPVQQTPYPLTPIQPAQNQQPQAWQGTPSASVPDAEVASRMVPVNTTSSGSTMPVTQFGTSSVPTQDSSTADGSDLMWRRPGS